MKTPETHEEVLAFLDAVPVYDRFRPEKYSEGTMVRWPWGETCIFSKVDGNGEIIYNDLLRITPRDSYWIVETPIGKFKRKLVYKK